MKNLQTMTLEKIKELAVKLNITLSYKDKDGKRKRYNKKELIAKIEEVETGNNNSVQTSHAVVYSNLNKSVKETREVENELASINIKTIGSYAKKLIAEKNIDMLKKLIHTIKMNIKAEKRNKLTVAELSKQLNIVLSLLRINKINGVA